MSVQAPIISAMSWKHFLQELSAHLRLCVGGGGLILCGRVIVVSVLCWSNTALLLRQNKAPDMTPNKSVLSMQQFLE